MQTTMGKNKNGFFNKTESGQGRKSYHQPNRTPPYGSVQEFEDDKPYMELCWEAEQDARFLLGISTNRTSFSMRAEPITPAGYRNHPALGSPLRKSYAHTREIKTESIYSQFKNNRNSFLDNRTSFLAYRPSKKDLKVTSKPSRSEKRLSSAILSKTPTSRKGKTPASRSKSDTEAYSYSQDYNTGTIQRDDDIDHLEDLRLSLLSWTTTTHESFVGSAVIPTEQRPKKTLHRTISDQSMSREHRVSPARKTPERHSEGKRSAVGFSGRSSRVGDWDATDDEVARITARASRTTSPGFHGSERSKSAQDSPDSLFDDSPTDSLYESNRLSHMRRMGADDKTMFLSRATRMPMRKYNFMAQTVYNNK